MPIEEETGRAMRRIKRDNALKHQEQLDAVNQRNMDDVLAKRVGANSRVVLALRDDGWLRVSPDGQLDSVYIKWKFTRGRWAGHYVMVRILAYDIDEGLDILVSKVQLVEQGQMKPTRDKPYEGAE